MATYKLVNADQLDSDLTAVGNAIRSKGGTSAGLSFPAGMVSAIGAISTGVELNFDVVPGLTQPGTAAENTIWVKAEKIGAWYFSATQPEGMVDYDVWFPVGTSSSVEFNALKKGGIQVYPLSAKQMVSGVLKDVTAKSYIGNEWVEWIQYLYNNGNTYDAITGGWDSSLSISKFNAYNLTHKNAEFGNTSIIFDLTSAGNFTYIPITSGLIDLSDSKTIYIDYTVKSKCYGAFLGVSSSKNIASVNEPDIPAKIKFLDTASPIGKATIDFDVSGTPTGKYYVVVWSYVGGSDDVRGCFEINSMWRE